MYDSAQTVPVTAPYRWPIMRVLADLILVLSASPGKTCMESEVMMARVRPSGLFELLSAAAWARALGYTADELSGKALSELMPLEGRAARQVVAELLDQKGTHSLEVTLRCKDQGRKYFRFHRRFDPYQEAVYVVADELAEERVAPLMAYS